jgi:hypothetical protein
MTPAQMAVDIYYADEADVAAAIDNALGDASLTLEALIEEAKVGRFSSEDARLAWWVISPFVDVP